jgi:hypothetical protein|tara:strand:- start:20 stop:649 length:630 start_codon:yes stop_codon:yes gene_type:complete
VSKNKKDEVMVNPSNYPTISEEVRKQIADKHRKISQTDTPKHFIKKKMGMDYCEISYMKSVAEDEYAPWNWEIIGKEALGTEAYVIHGRLTYTDANGVVRIGDMVAAHRIQKKRGTDEFVDIGNDIKASNTDCLKKALNMYLNIADDVYRNQVDDLELSDDKKDEILELALKCSTGRLEEVKKLIDNQTLNSANYKASYAKLQREVESK